VSDQCRKSTDEAGEGLKKKDTAREQEPHKAAESCTKYEARSSGRWLRNQMVLWVSVEGPGHPMCQYYLPAAPNKPAPGCAFGYLILRATWRVTVSAGMGVAEVEVQVQVQVQLQY
jgi:hypothetical protein